MTPEKAFEDLAAVLPWPLYLVSAGMRLLRANPPAEALVSEKHDGTFCSALGCPDAGSDSCRCGIREALDAAFRNGETTLRRQVDIPLRPGMLFSVFPFASAPEPRAVVMFEDEPPDREENYHDLVRTLMKAGLAYFVAISPAGKTIMINDAFLDAVGRTRKEVLYRDYLSLMVPPDEHDRLRRIFAQIMESDETVVVTNDVLTASGRRLSVEWHGRRVADASGKARFFFGIGLDITERLKLMDALKKSEERFRAIFEASPFGIILYDADARKIVLANPAFARFVGRSPEEILEIDPASLVHPEDWERYRPRLDAFYSGDSSSFVLEERFLRPDGSPVWGRVVFAKLGGGDASSPLLVVVEDIDRLKRLEEQADKAREHAAYLARLDTMWEIASRSLHTAFNVLNALSLLADDIERRAGDPAAVVKNVAEMRKALGGLEDLRNTMRSARPADEKPIVADLRPLVRQAASMAGLAAYRNVDVRLDLPPSPLPVRCFPSAMKHAFANLFFNALDAVKNEGAIAVEARIEEPPPSFFEKNAALSPGPYVVLSFADTGCGIPPEKLRKIFEPFFTTKRRGTGMGLAFVMKTVRDAGGAIEVESEPGRGTRFTLYLPCASGG
ncbi:MAG: hypothetical protein DRP90_04715 [Planctomycetota bacterium]|nr:MAG: hypothetical protein DRP90_04715 [Planctomycetota bacterium]